MSLNGVAYKVHKLILLDLINGFFFLIDIS